MYKFTEHGVGYKVGRALQPWRPQNPVILKWVAHGTKVLDAGCGDGVLGELLAKRNSCTVYGFDLDPIGVKEAKRRGVSARVWDAEKKFPYRTGAFDYVILSDLIQLISNPDQLVRESLRTGRKVIVQFPNFGFWYYRLEHILGHFPAFSLYGHQWWNTSITKFLSLADFYALPAMKNVRVTRLESIDWKNRKVSILAKLWPNFFGRTSILEIEK